MNTNNQITIVIVLYNSSNLIFDCLNSLDKFSIILVDNGKNLHLLEKLKERKNIKIISKNRNLGYGKAINFAFEFIQSQYFLVLNPDITIDESSIFKLLETALRNENCAIAAPLNKPDEDSFGILPEKRNLYEKNKNSNLKRPAHWGGIEIFVHEIEFWQGRENRLHNRVISNLISDKWKHNLLSP